MYFLQTIILAISIATNFLTALVIHKDHNDSTLKGVHLLHVEHESAQTLAKHWDSNKRNSVNLKFLLETLIGSAPKETLICRFLPDTFRWLFVMFILTFFLMVFKPSVRDQGIIYCWLGFNSVLLRSLQLFGFHCSSHWTTLCERCHQNGFVCCSSFRLDGVERFLLG